MNGSKARSRRGFPNTDDFQNCNITADDNVYSQKLGIYKKKKDKLLTVALPMLTSALLSEEEKSNDSLIIVNDDPVYKPSTPVKVANTEDEKTEIGIGITSLRSNRNTPPKFNKKTKKIFGDLDKLMGQYKENHRPSFSEFLGESLPAPPPAVLNENVIIRIKWKTKIMRFTLNRNETFLQLVPEIATALSVPANKIQLIWKDELISLCETPAAIKLETGSIIECFLTCDEKPEDAEKNNIEPNTIEVKLQSKIDKRKTLLRCHQLEPLQKLLERYATVKNLDVGKLHFQFDGETVDSNDTPHDLDIEDGDCLDVVLAA